MASHTKLYCKETSDCKEFGMKQTYCRLSIHLTLIFQKKKRKKEKKEKRKKKREKEKVLVLKKLLKYLPSKNILSFKMFV